MAIDLELNRSDNVPRWRTATHSQLARLCLKFEQRQRFLNNVGSTLLLPHERSCDVHMEVSPGQPIAYWYRGGAEVMEEAEEIGTAQCYVSYDDCTIR